MEVISTLIGVLVGTYISYFGSLRLLKRQEFYKASTKFKVTLIPIILSLKSESYDFNIIDKSISRQEEAYSNLIACLKKSEWFSFETAWKEYAYPNQKDFNANPRLEYRPTTPEEEKEVKKKIKKRIERLMKFVEK